MKVRKAVLTGVVLIGSTGCTAQEWTTWHNVFGGQNVVLCDIEATCPVSPPQRLDILVKRNVTDWDTEWVNDRCADWGGKEVIVHQWLDTARNEYRYDVVCEDVDY